MKKLLILAIIAQAIWIPAFAQDKKSEGSKIISKMDFSSLEWNIPEIGKEAQRAVLENGMIIYTLENHELPLINAQALVRVGSIYNSDEEMAIAGLTGSLVRTGGTKSFSPDSINSLLEFIAGSIESGIGMESGAVSMSILSKDIDLGLKIFAEVLRYPTFDTAKLSLEKSQIRESIRRRNDRPGGIISREFDKLLYGGHPYGRILEWSRVKNIGKSDLIKFHQRFFYPSNIMISFSGDFETGALINKLNEVFAGWENQSQALPPIPDVTYEFKPGVYVIHKGITQANVYLGHLGVKRDNPDRYAIALMNYILGGGSFTSRLTSRIRSDEGLAYSVRSNFSTSSRDYGLFNTTTQTKNPTAYRAIQIFREEIERMRTELPSESEFGTAQEAYINNFVFQFESPSQIINGLMSLEFNGYAPDYYKRYLANVKMVKIDDVKRVAEKYLKPEQLSLMILADTSKVEGNLGDFGEIHYITLESPKVD